MKQNQTAIDKFPPFTRTLLRHITEPHHNFDTPGHHGGQFYRLTEEGTAFVDALGNSLFLCDISDSDDELGDPSSHEGWAGEAEKMAATTFHADRTWFVLHGTSASNRICCEALLSPGDLVLFDRNNHKSLYQGALLKCDTRPVYLYTERLPGGIIGGLRTEDITEDILREKARQIDPEKGNKKHPFRLACLQSTTYDGFVVDAPYLIRLLSPLCDYILFDSAWGGYESFLPLLSSHDPLQVETDSHTAGILVTQSVHKQLLGLSQTSQIHKKDIHIRNEPYYLPDDVLNNAFLMNISTSPYFPLFASLEMNAYLHQKYGNEMWTDAARWAIHLRKDILTHCENIRPFIPREIEGKPWHTYDTETLLHDKKFWSYEKKLEEMHGEKRNNHYLIDPCKILLTTNEGPKKIPAALLSMYLQQHHITPEKTGLHSILFLMEPGDTKEKTDTLLAAFFAFENHLWNEKIEKIFPHLPSIYPGTLKELANTIETFLAEERGEVLESALFSTSPKASPLTGKKATDAFIKGDREHLPLEQLQGHIALECAMIYPPGICAITAGEIWDDKTIRYFQFIEKFQNRFPHFAPHTVGLHSVTEKGEKKLYAWVYKKK